MKYDFETPCIEATFLKKKSQYSASVEIYGEEYSVYFPSKEKCKERNIPCLLSIHKSLQRKTPYTIEAIKKEEYWSCIHEKVMEEALLYFLKEKETEGYFIEWNIMRNPMFISHLKDIVSQKKKTMFIEWKPMKQDWKETDLFWIEEAIDQGCQFIYAPMKIDEQGIELTKWENKNEAFL